MRAAVDVSLSRSVADAMVERDPRARDPGDCWGNAFRAIPDAADILGFNPMYVEGRAGGSEGDVPHAWLEAEDGGVIEVTPGWLEAAEILAAGGSDLSVRRYVPVARYTVAEVLDALDQNGGTLPIAEGT